MKHSLSLVYFCNYFIIQKRFLEIRVNVTQYVDGYLIRFCVNHLIVYPMSLLFHLLTQVAVKLLDSPSVI